MTYPRTDQPGGPLQAPAGSGIAVQEYRSAPEMQAEMARLRAHGWYLASYAIRDERKGNAVATVLLFIVGWFALFLTWPLMYWTWPRSSDVFVVTYTVGASPSWSTDPPPMTRRRPTVSGGLVRWRKATWANIIWNALMAWLLVGGLQNTQVDERYGAFAIIALGMAVQGLLVIWFVGSITLALIWLVSMPKRNTAVFGPQGRHAMLTEQDAKRWVEREGWSYFPQPPSGGPPRPPPAGPRRPGSRPVPPAV